MTRCFFVLFSLSRSGSSALFRALKAHSKIRIAYEPKFSHACWDERKVLEAFHCLRNTYSGIKHVWDPSGWPFVGTHLSCIEEMEKLYEKNLRFNRLILEQKEQRVLFLRRRDQLARVLSDQLGQQTDVWTPAHPAFKKAAIATVANDAKTFRNKVRARAIRPISLGTIEWYLKHIPELENCLRGVVADDRCMDLYYEDLFDPGKDATEILSTYAQIVDFLGFSSDSKHWDDREITALFSPQGKLNDSSTLEQIPNIAQIRKHFASSVSI